MVRIAAIFLAASAAGCVVNVPVSSTAVGGAMLIGIIATENEKPPELTTDRVVNEVDCTKPIPEGLTGNVRCAPPRVSPDR